MTGREIYKKAIQIIETAEAQKSTDFTELENMGFSKTDLNEPGKLSGRVPNDLYSIKGDDDVKVEVQHWAYDPTKPFQSVSPDLNKIHVTLYEGGEPETYSTEYYDPPYGSV